MHSLHLLHSSKHSFGKGRFARFTFLNTRSGKEENRGFRVSLMREEMSKYDAFLSFVFVFFFKIEREREKKKFEFIYLMRRHLDRFSRPTSMSEYDIGT